jgi:uncharacterized spore protein YtfJ
MVHLDGTSHFYEKLLDFAPQVVDKIQQMMGNNNQNENQNQSNGQNTLYTQTNPNQTPPI